MSRLLSIVALATLPALSLAACQRYIDAAVQAASNLQSGYFVDGRYGDQQPWIGAVDTFYLERLDRLTGQSTYSGVIDTVFNGWWDHLDNAQSFDDVQWVTIAYLQHGNLDQARKYYGIASQAVDSSYCGGGLFWSGARDYKNAITNELYMATSGYLYDVTQDTQYLTNLLNTWGWFSASDMRGSNGLYNDGLTRDGTCANNGQTQWTYNQGVVLVGLGYLYKHTQDESAIETAFSIMDAIIDNLTVDGGLRESCESTSQNFCNADQATFKGILTYYMAWYLEISGRDNGTKYADFIKTQADKILQFAVGPEGWYSNLWYGANEGAATWTAGSQASSLGALVAAGQQSC